MRLDIYSDTICPWCYVGMRRFERALAMRPQSNLAVRWRTFLLNPGMARDGMERRAYLLAKFGSLARARRVQDAARAAGALEDIRFAFDRIERTPSSIDSHRLLRYAAARGRRDTVLEGIFRAYFIDGLDIGDAEVLAGIGAGAGLEKTAVRRHLTGDADVEATLAEDMLARRAGVNGVPCFVFNGRYTLSGAQEPEALMQLFDLAREDDAAGTEALAGA